MADETKHLIDTVEELVRQPRTLEGDDVLKIQGPSGIWKVRLKLNDRGYWNMTITAPDNAKFYSVAKLKSNVSTYESSAKATAPAKNEVLQNEVLQTEEQVASSAVILARARFFLFRKDVVNVVQMCERVARLRAEAEEAERALVQCKADCDARYARLCSSVRHLETVHPSSFRKSVTSLDTIRPGDSLISSMTDHTGFTRESVLTATAANLEKHAPNTIENTTAMAMSRTPHFPLILGVLPLPSGAPRIVDMEPIGTVTVLNTSTTLTPRHSKCLKKAFSHTWNKHVDEMLRKRPVAVYDVFRGKSMTDYIGSVILSKYLTRRHGQLAPAISIESIVAQTKERSMGAMLFTFCKKLLFSDSPHITHGYLFAQCLPVHFWTFKLDIGNVARTLVFQLYLMYANYHLEEDCEMRALRVDLADETEPSSPAKRKI